MNFAYKFKTAMAAVILTSAAMSFPLLAQSEYDNKFTSYPTYSGEDLELTVDNTGTHFKLWSPKAEKAVVRIYDTGRGGEATDVLPMVLDHATGVWAVSVPRQLYGKFYTFQITQNGKRYDETPGVWAKAVGINGKRAAIIDLAATNPDGWLTDKGPEVKRFTDVVLYEMHHRDMSMHPNSGIANKGKFLALTEKDVRSLNGQTTGLQHLKDLGITHIHILPSYDYNSVDETQLPSNQYNWGYDPQNYNVPEGSYSTNPSDPATRIREMKEMIKALHDAGIGVVMDVVYNHTAENDGSNFELTVPGYYHRHWDDGRYSDASGCGNETASERRQMRDFIINSTKYWAKEYHIDGFRFDLMAIHDIETMNEVAAELKKINPNIFVYGEGWTAGDSPLAADRRALKENVGKMQDIAVFSDDIRDAVKGHYSNVMDRGFATGKPGQEETVKIGIVAATAHPQVDYSKGNNSKFAYATSPQMIVNYVSCHDDLTLTDKLKKSMPEAPEEDLLRMAKLAQTIVFTSQGTPFMFAGEEIFRDKKGVHNSFKSPDSINAIDWNKKADYLDQFNYYKNLIALRKAHPAFRMATADDIAKNLKFDKIDNTRYPNLISYSINGSAVGDSWKSIRVIFNGADHEQHVTIPGGVWKQVAYDGQIAEPEEYIGEIKGGKIAVPRYSALILVK